MVKFALLRVPVTVDWWFWLAAVLLGGGASVRDPQDWGVVLIWVAVVFVSVLVHEFGHALVGRRFGAVPFIRLHGFGGVTFLPGARFTRPQNVLVSAAGPAAGLVLGCVVLALAYGMSGWSPLMRIAVHYALYVNFVWSLINLLPIQPLDGGQILGQILGPSRTRMTAMIGFVVAVVLCVWAIWRGLLFSGVMLGMLAYYNFTRQPVEGGVVTP